MGLRRKDVRFRNNVMYVTFRRTKTIQFGERQLHIPLLSIPGSPLCPVSAFNSMVRAVPASKTQALFLRPGR